MKFSIIIPVYNTEKYIRKCLESLKKQTYTNFEVIIINDGSTDNSQSIINEFLIDNRFNCYIKKNGGLSDARNYGLNYVTGDYICFLDSDDYYDENLLNELNKIDYNYDMIKFKLKLVDEENNLIRNEQKLCNSGEVSVQDLFEIEFVEPAYTYIYKTSFFKNFKYEKNRVHEDYGLTPLCLLKANKVYYLDYYGYYYVQRQNSIMSSTNYKRRITDLLFHFDNLINVEIKEKDKLKSYKHFLARTLIYFSKIVPINEQKEYINELKKRNVSNYLLEDTKNKKIKKLFFKHFPRIYAILLRIIVNNKRM